MTRGRDATVELPGPDKLRVSRNAFIGWDSFEAECVESPEPTFVGAMFTFSGEYIITHTTKKHFYFFLDVNQEKFRVERSKVKHSPKGKLVDPDPGLPAPE